MPPKKPEPEAPPRGLEAWTLDGAKARLDELVRRAHANGPQRVTVRGRDAVVVVVSAETYDQACRKERAEPASAPVDSPLRRLEPNPARQAAPRRRPGRLADQLHVGPELFEPLFQEEPAVPEDRRSVLARNPEDDPR